MRSGAFASSMTSARARLLLITALLAAAAACPALRYPRQISSFLSADDREHLRDTFFSHRKPFGETPWRYFHMLVHASQPGPAHERTREVLERVRARVRRDFGPRFDIINDFFSWHALWNAAMISS